MTASKVFLALGGWALATALSLLLVVVVVVRLPPTYFRDDPAASAWPGPRRVVRIARNAAGVVLMAVGVLLSLPGIPGQGILTVLIGAMLVDFPGRRRLERRLVGQPGVLATMNRLRAWFGRPPLIVGGPPSRVNRAGP